jgi:hypothetical protein
MKIFSLFIIICLFLAKESIAQINHKLQTAFPFMLTNPEPGTGGMGEVGTSVLSSNNWALNYSKTVLLPSKTAISLSYTPWMKSLANSSNLAYLSGYTSVNSNSTIVASIRYLSLGKIDLTDDNNTPLGTFNPSEFNADIAFAKRFGEEFALALTLRYMSSSLRNNELTSNRTFSDQNSIATGISALYRHSGFIKNKPNNFSFGLDISSIGSKVRSSETTTEYLPTNLRIGVSNQTLLTSSISFQLAIDISKLMVPKTNASMVDQNQNYSVFGDIINSFSDGDLSDELKELNCGIGAEINFENVFKVRSGYFYENPSYGHRRYLTIGAGLLIKKLNIDLSYILANPSTNPIGSTLRIGLGYNFKIKDY